MTDRPSDDFFDDRIADDAAEVDEAEPVEFKVRPVHEGRRIDRFLAARFTDRSRSFFQKLIRDDQVLVNGRAVKPSYEVARDDVVRIELPPPEKREITPEPIPLDLIYEDDYFVVINKPPGMIVHPARGNWGGTLVNALAYHFQQLSGLYGWERPGVVHRLDRDTTGVIVVAKSDTAHAQIARQWENRRVAKQYLALVEGRPELDADEIDRPIGRNPRVRERMTIDGLNPREARTRYHVERRFDGFARVRAEPETGRTHQVRVHLASVGLRIIADAMYSSRSRLTLADLTGREADAGEVLIERQALHAWRLSLWHPITGERMTFEAPVPEDMARTLRALEQHRPASE